MANNYYPQNTASQSYNAAQFFPQSQGNVFFINSSFEVANIPVSVGVSVAICMSEGTIYLKSMQNGSPVLMVYSLAPYTAPQKSPTTNYAEAQDRVEERIKNLEEHLDSILRKMNANGGKISEQLL